MSDNLQREEKRKAFCEKLLGHGGHQERARLLEEMDARLAAASGQEIHERLQELFEAEDRLSLYQEAEALITGGSAPLRLAKEMPRWLRQEGLEEEALRLEEVLLRCRAHQMEALLQGEASDPAAFWNAYLEVRDQPRYPRALLGQLEERFRSLVKTLAEEQRQSFFRMAAEDLEDRAASSLGITDELDAEGRIQRFLSVRREIRALLDFYEGDARHRRSLKRLARRLRVEAEEARLALRLERIFGYLFIKILESAVLVGIFAVLGLFILELIIQPQGELRRTFLWIDTGICAVFLFEFGLKLAFSPARIRYFFRHLVIDFLPSIPYGMILDSMENLDYLRGLRAGRLFRLARILRYIKAVRPIIRLFRLFAFAFRGLDRLVHHLAPVLNYSLVFFDPPQSPRQEKMTVARLENRLIVEIGSLLIRFPQKERREALRAQATRLEARLISCEGARIPISMGPRRGPEDEVRVRELRVEDAVQALLRLSPVQVEGSLGPTALGKLAQFLRLLNIPILRSLPIIGPACRAATGHPPAAAVASAGRSLARSLMGRIAVLEWIGDLSGIVTGPQLLDRVSSAIVQATKRPAVRLLLLGFIFLLVKAVLGILEVEWLNEVLKFLTRALGIPIIVVGLLSAAILTLGRWLKSIAGEASETYHRTAEAQFINLLEDEKLRWKQRNLGDLHERVLSPEARVLGLNLSQSEGPRFLDEAINPETTNTPPPELEETVMTVGLLYRDYLDGAPLHHTDTKVAEQLIGNLSLRSIRTGFLRYSSRKQKRIKKLDLSRDQALFGGPLLWFRFITESLALETAKLLLEYNQKAIPVQELEYRRRMEPERVKRYQRWLQARLQGSGISEPKRKDRQLGPADFTALHFLSMDPKREHWIRERYGEDVLRAVQQDRRRLIRHIFGTWPFHRLPRPERTVNFYQIYRSRFSGGRIVMLPFFVLGLYLRFLWWLGKKVHRAVQEIRSPEKVNRSLQGLDAPYHVAKRKIERMRKPILVEYLQMRALFDVEYLGLKIPWGEGYVGGTWEQDLTRIGAHPLEREFYRRISGRRSEQLARWESQLQALFGSPRGLEEFLQSLDSRLLGRKNEILRSWTLAYVCDYQQLMTFSEIGEWVKEFPLPEKKTFPRFYMRKKRALLRGILQRKEVDPGAYCRALRWASPKILPALEACALRGLEGCRDLVRERLGLIAIESSRLTSFLTSLRAAQTISIFDLEYLQVMVRDLGAYDQE